MQINQHNYEEFFLMYVDNELSVQEKEIVDAFVMQHPDLAGELEILKQTVLDIGEPVDFAGKEKLIKRSELTEEDLLTYLDGEAASELAAKIEEGVKNDEILKLELENLNKLYLKADPSIQYASKEKLYKRGAVRSMDWRKLAIAASLLLCVSAWLVLNQAEQGESEDTRVAFNTPPVKQPAEPAPAVVDTNTSADIAVVPVSPSSDENLKNTERQRKTRVETDHRVTDPITPKEPVTVKTKVISTPDDIDHSGKLNQTNPPTSSPEPGKVPVETLTKLPSTELSVPVASVKEPAKEKKSLFKKIGKQISDRALDILSDGGDNINVAGFAIRLEK